MSSHPPAPAPTPAVPRVLLAEDDPTSAHFFKVALEQYGCLVTVQGDGTSALAQACAQHFDLLLLDCRMPGMGAIDLLSRLRAEAQAASRTTPALATSAETDSAHSDSLRQAGFVDLLLKPVPLQALHDAIRPLLGERDTGDTDDNTVLLDDAQALHNSGNMTAVHALRVLFAQELERLLDEWDRLIAHPAQLAERLHRLLASCGFCGATALASATRRMKRHLDATPLPPTADEREHFRATLKATLHDLQPPH